MRARGGSVSLWPPPSSRSYKGSSGGIGSKRRALSASASRRREGPRLANLSADLSGRYAQRVHVHVAGSGAKRADELAKFSFGDALPAGADDVSGGDNPQTPEIVPSASMQART